LGYSLVRIGLIGLTVVFALAFSTPSSANLVVNGGFESGDFSGWTGGFPDNFVATDDAALVHSGQFGVAFGAVGALSDLSQTLTTIPGQIYNISFWLDSNGLSPDEVKLSWGGVAIFDQSNIPANGWTQYSFLETALSTSTLLDFGLRQDSGYSGLDDVSVDTVSAVPEPSTWAMLLLGFAGIAALRFRRGRVALL
jgi:PEP-CTERM motif-containing protein